jgi:hypothetical protein
MTELRTELHDEEQRSTAGMAAAGEQPIPGREVRPDVVAAKETRLEPDAASQTVPSRSAPLFLEQEAEALRARWDSIQTGFVDNPRRAVEQADHLVSQTIKRLADGFANERNQLEEQWSRGGDVSTEDLRVALQRYRSFFDRLLSL